MTGFRKGLSAADSVLEFSSAADSAKKRMLAMLAVFVDVRQAFDNVTGTVAANCLQVTGVTGRALRFVVSLLTGRTAQRNPKGNRKRRRRIEIKLRGHTIPHVKTHRFLGVTIDEKLSWSPQVVAIKSTIGAFQSVLKRLRGTDWGCSSKVLCTLHNSLVLSRILYALPYALPPATRLVQLEAAHRMGLRNALGLPQQSSSELVYGEAGSMPVRLFATERLLQQYDRLHRSHAGKKIIRRIRRHRGSRFKKLGRYTYKMLVGPRPSSREEEPPFLRQGPRCSCSLRGLRKKSHVPSIVAKALVQEAVLEKNEGALEIYTDGSTNPVTGSSKAAFWCPALEHSWGGRIDTQVSSTLAELVAIKQALEFLLTVAEKSAIVLTDSKCSLQRICNPRIDDPIAHTILEIWKQLKNNGTVVGFQWVPSHAGIFGNETADRIANSYHKLPSEVPAPLDPRHNRKQFSAYVREIRLTAYPEVRHFSQPCPVKDLNRKLSTLLHRLRCKSVMTPAFRYKLGFASSPRCEACFCFGDLAHIIMDCAESQAARDTLISSFSALSLPCGSLDEILYPQGPTHIRRKARDALLAFASSVELS
ncbi:uncharacterized protein LOC135395734 [Ornithodoros turicata]|uniref:uncharacterized protein LOC135395734 n=1 Tax=Ornithodoros turicata TaxID=34597 RepID=UPI00313A22FA